MGRTPLIALLAVLLIGCAEPTEPVAPGDRFAGEWMVEQPFHAGYEASWYLFHESGQLEHLRDCVGRAGFVSNASDSIRCQFGDRWSAEDGDTLVIDGACSDALGREMVLGFPADTNANAVGQSAVEVVSVGGEDGWHFEWDWVWQKCGDASCVPALDQCR